MYMYFFCPRGYLAEFRCVAFIKWEICIRKASGRLRTAFGQIKSRSLFLIISLVLTISLFIVAAIVSIVIFVFIKLVYYFCSIILRNFSLIRDTFMPCNYETFKSIEYHSTNGNLY